jgi:hypothetical protein
MRELLDTVLRSGGWDKALTDSQALAEILRARFAPAEPAAKQEPRTWTSLDQVPHDVTVTGGPKRNRPAVWATDRFTECGPDWRWETNNIRVATVLRDATWTEVVDGAQ